MAENQATTYLTRTPDTPTNNKKYTLSVWVKVSNMNTGDYTYIISSDAGSTLREHIVFEDGTAPFIKWYSRDSGSTVSNLSTNRVFRDPSAWMHLVFVYDSTAVEADRQKIYINGVRDTSFRTNTPLAADVVSQINNTTNPPKIGMLGQGPGAAQDGAFEGCMSNFHFCDGQTLAASDFGETDSTSGIWKIKTSPSVTYGDNGYFIFEADNGVTDQSGEGNNWTENGAGITLTKDNPSNNFCTWTPLINRETNASTFSNGNTTVKNTNANWGSLGGTLCAKSGKWYYEVIGGNTTGPGYMHYGFASVEYFARGGASYGAQGEPGTGINFPSYTYYGYNGNIYYNTTTSNGTTASYGDTFVNTDYIGVFLDLDNSKMYWSKNGTIQNSGTGFTIDNANSDFWTPITGTYSDATGHETNFGNGYFGTTVLTGTTYEDENGEGTFKYSPNDGGSSSFDGSAKDFYAVCTNNIKLYGG